MMTSHVAVGSNCTWIDRMNAYRCNRRHLTGVPDDLRADTERLWIDWNDIASIAPGEFFPYPEIFPLSALIACNAMN